jgi:CRP-like cAMP-binding protein
MELRQVFNHIFPITDDAWIELESIFTEINLGKNQYLHTEGDRAHYCYFLKDGVVRVYYTFDGNEYNKTFFISGTFPTPITALITQKPSLLNYQALTDCQLIQFSYQSFRNLFEKHRCLESLMLAIMEREWINKERHDIQMVTNDATKNYLIFREEYPKLENLIPQYHISSYLGITPIQLSRIRAQLAKK